MKSFVCFLFDKIVVEMKPLGMQKFVFMSGCNVPSPVLSSVDEKLLNIIILNLRLSTEFMNLHVFIEESKLKEGRRQVYITKENV